MTTEFRPKGWHIAVRHVFNGMFDAREALRRNNSGMTEEALDHWLKMTLNRAEEKAKKSGLLEDR